MSDGLKDYSAKPSGRPSIIRGTKYCRGFIVRPEQIMELLHDTQPGLPLPQDAEHKGIGVDDAGVDSKIQFFFTSKLAPHMTCLELRPEYFFRILVNLSDGLLPIDSELDGIEISSRFTMIMLRVRSSHWPDAMSEALPLYHLRYEVGKGGTKQLMLFDPAKSIENERRIRIH